jgi:hypothetical protein
MIKRQLRAAAALVCVVLATAAQAQAFECRVTVQGVLAYSGGSVNVLHSGRNDWTVVCNLDRTYQVGSQSVSPTTCAVWYATLLRAKKNNQPVDVYFYDPAGSCAAVGTYGSAPVPVYIGEIR